MWGLSYLCVDVVVVFHEIQIRTCYMWGVRLDAHTFTFTFFAWLCLHPHYWRLLYVGCNILLFLTFGKI